MKDKHPSDFNPNLQDKVLNPICELLLEEYLGIAKVLDGPYDDNYGRGCGGFSRSKNRLYDYLLNNNQHGLFKVTNASNAFTFNIGSTECRFFKDNPDNPQKGSFYKPIKDPYTKDLFENENENVTPVAYCRFIYYDPIGEEDEAGVAFQGFDIYGTRIFNWNYADRSLIKPYIVEKEIPLSVGLSAAPIEFKEKVKEKNSKIKIKE